MTADRIQVILLKNDQGSAIPVEVKAVWTPQNLLELEQAGINTDSTPGPAVLFDLSFAPRTKSESFTMQVSLKSRKFRSNFGSRFPLFAGIAGVLP